MRAVILVGGEGTRLRPLTSELPKPAVKLVDRPMMAYMLEWLATNGIAEVVMEDKLIEQMGTGQSATFIIFNTPEEGVGIPLALTGFKDAYAKLP